MVVSSKFLHRYHLAAMNRPAIKVKLQDICPIPKSGIRKTANKRKHKKSEILSGSSYKEQLLVENQLKKTPEKK
ncbi:unnamed protein product [Acanthoscelides obtectus]|uniref:Uncharacterized protein n=1 Tax=Acanthoscelides obtectus TaxID=200917 RepID=A0A9P0L3N6_ACAOB|nr:unnamed protein product [Acanthoscelides obtectus]CAK1649588.1 hypothetical protein AOBTE_LOCUS16318 [Acanthoscelides obtectus]